MSHTVAAIDCGTNSIRLLVLRREADGALAELCREVRLARLGQGVDATGQFHPDALARAGVIFDEFAEILRDLGVERARFVATAAARDVSNRDVFEADVRQRLGLAVDVISGDEEARLSAAGVLSGVDAEAPVLVFDIGGGSTEFVLIDGDRQVVHAVSTQMGAVRVKERFFPDDPPTSDQISSARAFVLGTILGTGIDFSQVATAVGVAGTVTSVAASVLGLREYSREAVHGTLLDRGQIAAVSHRWLAQTAEQTAQEPCMHPLRAGVLGAGSVILDEIAAQVPGQRVLVSETDILDGIAHGLLTT
ncbi:MAG TPA: Ppx/GppA phosphatase family protein [Arachnia sp.]|nr:Ppx/GppA phosphatase family protein [Arachnia sp.]HMT85587.1 Ppx/GppA phosphatase family protein [Arachnia sp.]